jgi:hypothetical protein
MRTLLRSELQAPLPQSQPSSAVTRVGLSAAASAKADDPADSIVAVAISKLFRTPEICSAHERHVRRPGWTELFFDLVFAAAIAQLSAPLDHDYSLFGIARFALLLALVFLAWFGYTTLSTQLAVDDVIERALIVVQIFLVAVMAANATDMLASRDAAGFGAAYGGARAILALQYVRVMKSADTGPLVRRRIVGLFVAAILWAVSALLPVSERYAGSHRDGHRRDVGTSHWLAPAIGLAVAKQYCAGSVGSRVPQFADHRHCASFATLLLLRRANSGAEHESPALGKLLCF